MFQPFRLVRSYPVLHSLLASSVLLAAMQSAQAQSTPSMPESAPGSSSASDLSGAGNVSGASASPAGTSADGVPPGTIVLWESLGPQSNPANNAATDPLVKRRQERAQAKAEYRQQVREARSDYRAEKRAARQEYREDKREADREAIEARKSGGLRGGTGGAMQSGQ